MPSNASEGALGVPVIAGAIVGGLVIGMVPANVWPLFLVVLKLPVLAATAAEILFLAIYVWWARGGGPPRHWRATREEYFRVGSLSGAQWFWGLAAALGFAVTVHSAIVLLFRFVPYPAAAFHQGYDMSVIPTRQSQYLACILSALSAGVCEEIGFRGYMQRPIEKSHGPLLAILISSFMFTLLHLTKGWALIGMVPIVFGAGLLLGVLARASGTLWFGIIGHWIMDIGLFTFWWAQVAGTFNQKPISETGVDNSFYLEAVVFVAALALVIEAISRLVEFRDAYSETSTSTGVLSS
jgi:membrane protease YdiL (CAAX protease family)